jgi:aryl-alcohol dehydrogenase-like predicted oxidoreductase
VNHIDTSDFYGPHVTNQLIREALHPYRDDLTIVTKIGPAATIKVPGCRPFPRRS